MEVEEEIGSIQLSASTPEKEGGDQDNSKEQKSLQNLPLRGRPTEFEEVERQQDDSPFERPPPVVVQ